MIKGICPISLLFKRTPELKPLPSIADYHAEFVDSVHEVFIDPPIPLTTFSSSSESDSSSSCTLRSVSLETSASLVETSILRGST